MRKDGHGVKDYELVTMEEKGNSNCVFPYLVALKAKSSVLGKENFQFQSIQFQVHGSICVYVIR